MYSVLILDIIEQRKFIDTNKFHCLIKFDMVCLPSLIIIKKEIQKTSLKNAPQKQNGNTASQASASTTFYALILTCNTLQMHLY